ncbi:unnamed protein product [Acanthoscelides obtectus]|uniref:Uncharacterized protein n=1 Tax=Acanthoscelides obtectus TaxID=200917 RepID=A0A9P0KBS6_ACAOB|nr:unnamed protein product [Acanthoscelides obtectus]CAK1677198.1 hypothetical protein AOBTE_LOCUS31178 [Acanthoscelides obtectus]
MSRHQREWVCKVNDWCYQKARLVKEVRHDGKSSEGKKGNTKNVKKRRKPQETLDAMVESNEDVPV